jgi:hypothetical protein
VNVGRSQWNICEVHKVKWFIGENLFSDWHDETEEDWKQNATLIADFKEVEPVYLDDQTGRVGTRAELDAITAARREPELPVAAGPGSDDEPEQVAAKAALLAECDKLADAGVTLLAVHFDGSGDEGTTDNVRCYDGENYDYEQEPVEYDASLLQDHFDALVPYGYENNSGGFGDVVLDVKARKITVERNDRFEDYTTTTHEI